VKQLPLSPYGVSIEQVPFKYLHIPPNREKEKQKHMRWSCFMYVSTLSASMSARELKNLMCSSRVRINARDSQNVRI
jgi:hypothetical protein